VGTLYDQAIRPGNPAEPRLLYDPLGTDKTLAAADLRQVIALILTHRYNYPRTTRTSRRSSPR
jgi:hypothetical protein